MRIFLLSSFVFFGSLLGIACLQPSQAPDAANEEKPATEVVTPNIDANSLISPATFDEDLLTKLVLDGINELRRKKGAKPLLPDVLLAKAANDQNEYVTNKGKLMHEQSNPEKRDVSKRIDYYGGSYDMVGENLQLYGFMVITKNGKKYSVEYTSYKEAAKGMVENWVTSKPHYENLVRKEFTLAGTSIGFNKDKTGFYSTQVYASFPIER